MHFYLTLLLIVVILASCSGKRYGHYAYVKMKVLHNATSAKTKKKLEQVTSISAIQSLEVTAQDVDDIAKDTIVAKMDRGIYNGVSTTKAIQNNKWQTERYSYTVQSDDSNKLAAIDTIVKNTFTIRNYEAGASMTLGIIALFFALFALVFTPLIFVAFAFGLGAFALAKEARNEIKRRPELYSNKDEAAIGYVIGYFFWVIFMAGVVLLILLILLLIILIAISIAGFIMMY